VHRGQRYQLAIQGYHPPTTVRERMAPNTRWKLLFTE